MIEPVNPVSKLVFVGTDNYVMFSKLFTSQRLYNIARCEFHVTGVAIEYGSEAPPLLQITLRQKI